MSPINDYSLVITTAFIILFFIAALPLKNWLEIKSAKSEEKNWTKWLKGKPNLEDYCKAHNQDISTPTCDYCGSKKQLPRIEKSIPFEPRFGIVDNNIQKTSHYRAYICTKCGSELYREMVVTKP